jgi:cell division protein sepF
MKNQKKLFLFFNFYDKINVVNVKYQTRGGIKVGLLKKILSNDEDVFSENITGDEYYDLKPEEALKENDGSTKMILLEPRAYSEAQQIADHLKMRNTVVVNLKRVTSDQAKRIIDFLAGTIYAIGGDLQKIGGGIFLCTPNNINIQGKITEETEGKDIHDNDDINIEW